MYLRMPSSLDPHTPPHPVFPTPALHLITVYLVSTQQQVDITSLWGEDERVVLAFARSMG